LQGIDPAVDRRHPRAGEGPRSVAESAC
jgi:hypothetical protein